MIKGEKQLRNIESLRARLEENTDCIDSKDLNGLLKT